METAESKPPPAGLLVSGDLIFSTKITGTARALGINMRVASTADAARARLTECRPRCVLVDLSMASLDEKTLSDIVTAADGASVLAFGSHVDTVRLDLAARAGCTEVMPRSRLSNELPSLLQRYCLT